MNTFLNRKEVVEDHKQNDEKHEEHTVKDEERYIEPSSGLIESDVQKPPIKDEELIEEEEKLPEKIEEKVPEQSEEKAPEIEEKVLDPKVLEKKQKYLDILAKLNKMELKNVEI
jgi:hypothetical protein